MSKKYLVFLLLLSVLFTLFSPVLFPTYFEERPEPLTKDISFGVPFPFIKQKVQLPNNVDEYPLEITYNYGYEKHTTFKIIPFLLSFLTVFLFFTAIITVLVRFLMNWKPGK